MKDESGKRSSVAIVATAVVFGSGAMMLTFGNHDTAAIGGIVMSVTGILFFVQTVNSFLKWIVVHYVPGVIPSPRA